MGRWMFWGRRHGRGVAILGLILAGLNAAGMAQETPVYKIEEMGVVPRPATNWILLDQESIRSELKLTTAQKAELAAIWKRWTEEIRQHANRDGKDFSNFRAEREAILKRNQAAYQATLDVGQSDRLIQIQHQLQGPLAFGAAELRMSYAGAPLVERLKLSDDQIRRVRVIALEGQAAIQQAASFPIVMDAKDRPPSREAIGKLVDGPEFKAAKQKARQAGREAWAGVIRQVEEVLTEDQRATYRQILGSPFDVSKLLDQEMEERSVDLTAVSQAFGIGGGQRADPNFDTKVARPAYPKTTAHPRVLFDEAHYNFHTTSGRYKPFGQLVGNDGYQVIPNREKFTAEVLQKGDILIIANALGAEGMGQAAASNPAFTDLECDAVRDWVKAGGSLLLITDHAPMGSAAECLAKRFEVNLSKGATSDPAHSASESDTFLVFTRQDRLLGDHPITRGRDDSERLNRIQTFTGTSLKGPEGSVPLLKLADTAVDLPYGENGTSASAAGRVQGLALSLGKGRVVILGEAAELSAQLIGESEKFGMNVPGIDNRQMALNIMHWLSGLLEPKPGVEKSAGSSAEPG